MPSQRVTTVIRTERLRATTKSVDQVRQTSVHGALSAAGGQDSILFIGPPDAAPTNVARPKLLILEIGPDVDDLAFVLRRPLYYTLNIPENDLLAFLFGFHPVLHNKFPAATTVI